MTLGALSLNGKTAYREQYEPLLQGFFQVETPYLYRNPFTSDALELGRICAELLEREIVYQGPDKRRRIHRRADSGSRRRHCSASEFLAFGARDLRPARRSDDLR